MWTARCTTLKNTKTWIDICEETEFLLLSQKPQFSKTDYRSWKSYKASSRDESMRSFGRWTLSHIIQSKFKPFCKQKFPPILHTSSLNAKFWNFNNTVFIRKKNPENVIKSLYRWFKSSENFGIFGLVVFSTQLHEQMHRPFLIAGNGDLRALTKLLLLLTFVSLCRLHFWSDCNEFSGAFEP